MNIRILFDGKGLGKQYKTGWGFSCLIGENLLFDTGPDCRALSFNMAKLGIRPESLEAIVISHEHDDHSGGLWKLCGTASKARIFHCPRSGREFLSKIQKLKNAHSPVRKRLKIEEKVFSTGSMPGMHRGKPIVEQSLVLKGDGGLIVITGCAHPGLLFVVRHVKKLFPVLPVRALIGGFHLKDSSEQEIKRICLELKTEGIRRIVTGHCTGDKATRIFSKYFSPCFRAIKVGLCVNI